MKELNNTKCIPCAHVSNGAAEKTQTHAENCHVPKIECGLEKAVHPDKQFVCINEFNNAADVLCLEEEIVE